MRNLNSAPFTQLTEMLHDCKLHVQLFSALQNWATLVSAPTPHCMIVHSDRRPATEHVCRYDGPQASEVAAIFRGAEDSSAGKQGTVTRCWVRLKLPALRLLTQLQSLIFLVISSTASCFFCMAPMDGTCISNYYSSPSDSKIKNCTPNILRLSKFLTLNSF